MPHSLCVWAALAACCQASFVYAEETQTQTQPPVAAAAAQPEPAAQPERVVRNVVVAQFAGDEDAVKARSAVLRALADHAEVEVVSMDDVSFASQRFKADAKTPEGRAKLSSELGVHAWLDGSVSGDTAQLTLSAADGSPLAQVELEASDGKQLDSIAGDRMWAAFGPRLSPYEIKRREVLAREREQREAEEAVEREQREAVERAQRAQRAVVERVEREQRAAEERAQREREAQPERARNKLEAREAEAERQRTLAHAANEKRTSQRALAQRKLSDRLAELSRQATLVKNQEGGRLAKADPGPATAPLPEPKPKAERAKTASREALAAPLTNTSGRSAHDRAHPEKVPSAGVSPATARWLAQQQAQGFFPVGAHAAGGGGH